MSRVKKAVKKIEGDSVVFQFAHGGEVLKASVNDLPESIIQDLLLHGISQKVGDSYSNCDVEHAPAAAKSVWESLVSGKWSMARESTGTSKVSQLAEALFRVYCKKYPEKEATIEDCVAKIAAMDSATTKSLKQHPEVHLELQLIAQEKLNQKLKKAEEEANNAPGFEL